MYTTPRELLYVVQVLNLSSCVCGEEAKAKTSIFDNFCSLASPPRVVAPHTGHGLTECCCWGGGRETRDEGKSNTLQFCVLGWVGPLAGWLVHTTYYSTPSTRARQRQFMLLADCLFVFFVALPEMVGLRHRSIESI